MAKWWELPPEQLQVRSRLARQPSEEDFFERQQAVEDDLFRRDRADDSETQRALNQSMAQISAAPKAVTGLARSLFGDEEGGQRDLLEAKRIIDREAEFAPRVQRLEDVDSVGSALEYGRNAILSNAPTMLPTVAAAIGTGGASALAGAGLRSVAKKGITKAIGNALTAKTGQAAGAVAASSALQSNQMLDAALDQDSPDDAQTRAAKAVTGAIGTGVLDALPTMGLLGRMGLSSAAKEAIAEPLQKHLTKRIASAAGKQAMEEGITEGIQTFGERLTHKWVNDNIEVIGPQAYSDYLNATVAGALAGGAIGGVGAVRVSDLKPQIKGDLKWLRERQRGPMPVEDDTPTAVDNEPTNTKPADTTIDSVFEAAKQTAGDMAAGVKDAAETLGRQPGKLVNFLYGKNKDLFNDADEDAKLDALFARFEAADKEGTATGDDIGIIGRDSENWGAVRGDIPYNGRSLFDGARAQMIWEAGRENGRRVSALQAYAMSALGSSEKIAEVGDEAVKAGALYLSTGDRSAVDEGELAKFLGALEPDQQMQYLFAGRMLSENLKAAREVDGPSELTPAGVRGLFATEVNKQDIETGATEQADNYEGGDNDTAGDYQLSETLGEEGTTPISLGETVDAKTFAKLSFGDAKEADQSRGRVIGTNSKGNQRAVNLRALVAMGWKAKEAGVFTAPNGVVDVVVQAIDAARQRGINILPSEIRPGLDVGGGTKLTPAQAKVIREGMTPTRGAPASGFTITYTRDDGTTQTIQAAEGSRAYKEALEHRQAGVPVTITANTDPAPAKVQETPGMSQVPPGDRPFTGITGRSDVQEVAGVDGVENMGSDTALRQRARSPRTEVRAAQVATREAVAANKAGQALEAFINEIDGESNTKRPARVAPRTLLQRARAIYRDLPEPGQKKLVALVERYRAAHQAYVDASNQPVRLREGETIDTTAGDVVTDRSVRERSAMKAAQALNRVLNETSNKPKLLTATSYAQIMDEIRRRVAEAKADGTFSKKARMYEERFEAAFARAKDDPAPAREPAPPTDPAEAGRNEIAKKAAEDRSLNDTDLDADLITDLIEDGGTIGNIEKEQALIDALTKRLGLKPITVAEMPAGRTAFGTYSQKYRVIFMSNKRQGNARLDTLLHELGHAIVLDSWENLPAATRQMIDAEYQKWLRTASGKRNWLQARKTRAPFFLRKWLDENKDDSRSRELKDMTDEELGELLSFDEFLADQLAKALGKNADTQSEIGKFFSELVAKLRELYDLFTGSAYEPSASFEAWVDGLVWGDMSKAIAAAPLATQEKILFGSANTTTPEGGARASSSDLRSINSRVVLLRMQEQLMNKWMFAEGDAATDIDKQFRSLGNRLAEIAAEVDRAAQNELARGRVKSALTKAQFDKFVADLFNVAATPVQALELAREVATPEQRQVIDILLATPEAFGDAELRVITHAHPDANLRELTTNTISGAVTMDGATVTLVTVDAGADAAVENPADAIVHEMVHLATILAEKHSTKAAELLQDLFSQAKAKARRMGIDEYAFYGLADTQEFIAEAMSNPVFQEFLRAGEPSKSLWRKFIDFVLRALGQDTPTTEQVDLFEKTLAILPTLANTNAAVHRHFATSFGPVGALGSANTVTGTPLQPTPGPSNLFILLDQQDRGRIEKVLREPKVREVIYANATPEVQRRLDVYGPDLRVLIDQGVRLWLDGKLDLSQKTPFRKLVDGFKAAMGLPTDQSVAEQIFTDYDNSLVVKGRYDGEAKAFDKNEYTKAVLKIQRAVTRVTQPVYDKLINDVGTRMRDTNVPALRQLASLFDMRTGEKASEQSFSAYRNQYTTQHATAYMEAVEGLDDKSKRTLARALQANERPTDARLAAAYDKMTALLDQYLLWGNANGVQIRRRQNYFPLVFDRKLVEDNWDDFVALVNNPQYETEIRSFFGNDTRTPLKTLAERMVQIAQTADESHVGAIDFSIGIFAPSVTAQRKQIMGFLTNQVAKDAGVRKQLAGYQIDSLDAIMIGYVNQMSKKAAYRKVFGASTTKMVNGQAEVVPDRIGRMMELARSQGATPEQLALARDFVNMNLGSYHAELNPAIRWTFKQIDKVFDSELADMPIEQWAHYQQIAQTYQNVRLLGLAALSSLIDPLGSLVRGGSFRDTAASMREAIGAMRGTNDLRGMAEDLGVIEKYAMADAMAATYGGSFDPQGKLGKINNALFKYNGLEAVTRYSRLVALAAGHRFLARQVTQPGPHTERWLKELGLTAADIRLDGNGRVRLNPKVEQALRRFVNESVVRPTPSQRPGWHNDPNFLFAAQYKGYLYSFWSTIVGRMEVEAANGNYRMALAPLVPYLGVTVAAEMARFAIQHPGEDDDRDTLEYAKLAMVRSGMAGPRFGVFNDARSDTTYGSWITNSWIGPTGQQLSDLATVATGDRSAGKTAIEALPGSAIFEDW